MTINEYLTSVKPLTIFSELNKKDVPWKNVITGFSSLDNLYQFQHSCNLICSSLCENLDFSALIEMIYTLNNENWTKLFENYTIKYNPIENYSMLEEYEKNNTGTQNNKQTGNTTSESTSNIFAYNVDDSNPVSSSTATSMPNLENICTNNLKEKNKLTRSGNIGVTTSAQMIKENVDLWKWKYFETIFNDIDKILTTGVYVV